MKGELNINLIFIELLKTKQLIGLILAILILAGMFLVSPTEALPLAARNTLGVLLVVIVLLVTEIFPIGITCLFAIVLLVLFNCEGEGTTVSAVLTGYTNPVLFFFLASFGISEALTIVPLSKRLLFTLMKAFGKNINLLLFAIMLATALLSSIVSNVAAVAVFIPTIAKFLDLYKNVEERKKTARCYMIALPVASMIGGMMTPAGSSINMLTIGLLHDNTDISIKFVDWMLFGVPLAIVILPIAWFFCIKIFKPMPISADQINHYLDEMQIKSKLSNKEIYVLVIILTMLALWIFCSPMLNVTVVMLIGLALFFVPGFQILTWADFRRCVSWEAFLLVGTMISIGAVITSSGLGDWISSAIFPTTLVASGFVIVALIAAITFVLLIPIPIAPALVTILSVPLIGFAGRIGVSPYMLMITLGLMAGNCYLLPLDAVPLMTFSTGSYKMFDLLKATVWIQICLIIIAAIWIPIVANILGV
jgi:sodium-dependent dicarboxylate transporter 2/3/5